MVCAKRAYNRFMAEALLNVDEKENPDELLSAIEKVLHADGNPEADKRIDSMSKERLNEILQIARILAKQHQQQKKRKKKRVETEEEEQDVNNTTTAKEQQQEIEEEEEITVQQ